MRLPERIPIILDKIDWKRFIEDHYESTNDLNILHKTIQSNLMLIKDEWTKVPDVRLGQLLIVLEILPDSMKLWNVEEVEWMIETNQLNVEDILFWGRNLDKNGNKLPKTEYILLRDVTPDHAKAILEYCKYSYLPIRYKTYFEKKALEIT